MNSSNTPQRALINEITGPGGSYLAEHIVCNHPKAEVHGVSRWRSSAKAAQSAAG